jgi:long-subunit fatty acid transport protein
MTKRKAYLFLIFLVLAGINLFSQVNDAQLWLSANLEKKLTPALSVLFTEEIRMNENITEAGTVFSELGLSYRLNKRFKAGASYRFMLKRRLDDTYEKLQSWFIEGSYREKFNPVQLSLRVRYQSRYAESFTSEKAEIPKNHFRTKITVKYDLKQKFEPYLYAEAFFRTGVSWLQSNDQMRFGAGVEYTFNRMHMIDLQYLIRHEKNAVNPETDYVVGVSYYLTF